MKALSFIILFACVAVNFMQVDVHAVEVAQAQQVERTMMADDAGHAAPVLVAAR